ncbi:MAG: VUT family protein [Anaerolineae bacterium]
MTRIVMVVAAYIAAQMLSDIMSLKIAIVAGLFIDAGTFIYPITFTLRDLAHKTLGIKSTRHLILTAAAINIFMALAFAFTTWLPADPSLMDPTSPDYSPSTAFFGAVLNPVWRIVIASIIAEVIAELVDTEIYHLWVTRVTRRYQWARVLTSNAVSVPLDSVIFGVVAFAGVLPAAVVTDIILVNIGVKLVTTLVSLPLIYAVPERNPTEPLLPAAE